MPWITRELLPPQHKRATVVLWCGVGLLALLWAWGTRRGQNPDAVSYLDLADAWRSGDWSHALSSYWSPLYSWLLIPVSWSRAEEFPFAHFLNLVFVLAALGGWAFLLVGADRALTGQRDSDSVLTLPVLVFAYALFAWAVVAQTGVASLEPDLLLAALTLFLAGILTRPASRPRMLALGVLTGLACLTKAVFFPLALVAFILALVRREPLAGIAGAAAVCVVIAAVVVVPLSIRSGHPTSGSTGGLNFAWFVQGAGPGFWEGQEPDLGRPTSPPRVLRTHPSVYVYEPHAFGTAPVWTQPAHWYAGLGTRLRRSELVRAMRRNAAVYRPALLTDGGAVALIAVAVLFAAGGLRLRGGTARLAAPALLLLALLVIYLPVTVEPRYVAAPFGGLVLLALLAARGPDGASARRAVSALLCAAAAVLVYYSRPLLSVQAPGPAVAQRLDSLGVPPGSVVAAAGDYVPVNGFPSALAWWARPARAKIRADIVGLPELWALAPADRAQIYARLRSAGIHAVISAGIPPAGLGERWIPLGYGYALRRI